MAKSILYFKGGIIKLGLNYCTIFYASYYNTLDQYYREGVIVVCNHMIVLDVNFMMYFRVIYDTFQILIL